MTIDINKPFTFLTIQQFVDHFFPTLVKHLKEEQFFTLKDAQRVGKNVINRLKWKFRQNKSQPVQVFQEAMINIVTRETNKYRRLMDKNFGLSEDSFLEMIKKLKNGDEEIFEKIFLSHFESCLSYIKFNYKASHEDAYDASMETMLTFCENLKDGKVVYGNLRFLFTQMAGQIYLKWLKKENRKEGMGNYDIEEEEITFDKESLDLLGNAWLKLGEGCQGLLKDFYHNKNTLKEIADKIGKTSVSLRKQKQRCIEKLRVYFTEIS